MSLHVNCRRRVNCMSAACRLHAGGVSTACWWRVNCMSAVCQLYAGGVSTACRWRVNGMPAVVCRLYVGCMSAVCRLYVGCVACQLYVGYSGLTGRFVGSSVGLLDAGSHCQCALYWKRGRLLWRFIISYPLLLTPRTILSARGQGEVVHVSLEGALTKSIDNLNKSVA